MTYSSRVTILDQQPNPIINQILFDLRNSDNQKDKEQFRRNLHRLGYLMAYEMAKDMPTQSTTVSTPLGQATQKLLISSTVIIGILRASIPMWLGALNAFRNAEAGLVAISRQEETFDYKTGYLDVHTGYISLPNTIDKHVVIVDPMIAAGNSIIELLSILDKRGHTGQSVILGAIASPTGLRRINQEFPEVEFVIASLDDKINEQAFVVPGLGDAGDLAFGKPI